MTENVSAEAAAAQLAASDTALARSVVYRFLACLFREPGETEAEERDLLLRGAAEAFQQLEAPEALAALGDVADGLRTAGADDVEKSHASCFGHTPRGRCPPYETEYGGSAVATRKPHELADLAGFYRAFGLEHARERADHISVECEFMHFLAHKEHHALEAGDTELAAVSRGAARTFLKEHLGCWAPALAARLSRSAPGLHGALGRVTLAFLRFEHEHLDVELGTDDLPLRPLTETPEDCRSCDLAGPESNASGG